jgi:hypothetical protein
MRVFARAAVAAALVLAAGVARADETTFCNQFITALPYTITVQGHYCLNKNLSTAITTGNAITINANFVLLDLNNFKVGGGSAGLGTQANGVFASDRQNVTIRNGNIRGFLRGVFIEDPPNATPSFGHVVENLLADQNTHIGIFVDGAGSIVRQNQVVAIGGSTVAPYSDYTHGIVGYGAHQLFEDNVVVSPVPALYNDGILTYGEGIAQRNTIGFGPLDPATYAFFDLRICRDNNIVYAQTADFWCAATLDNVVVYP